MNCRRTVLQLNSLPIALMRSIAAVRQATGCGDSLTEPPQATVIFNCFHPCSIDDVRSIIMGAPSKSCSLDPLQTDVLKIFLPELLPFITDMCNASLQQAFWCDTHVCLSSLMSFHAQFHLFAVSPTVDSSFKRWRM